MKAEEIVDQESFEAWLKVMPLNRAQTGWLSSRAALRTFPWALTSDQDANRLRVTELALRYYLRTQVYSNSSQKLLAFVDSEDPVESQLRSSITALTHTISDLTWISEIDPEDAEEMVWKEISEDCRTLFDYAVSGDLALWRVTDSPFERLWSAIQVLDVGSDASLWRFWLDWYDDVLAGRPQNIEMLVDIALEVDWDKTPAEVLAQIEGIRGTYAVEASFNAEVIREDPTDHLIEAIPVTDLPEDLRQDVHERVEHALGQLKGAMGQSNLLAAMRDLAEELEEAQAKYAEIPVRLCEEYFSIAQGIAHEVAQDAELGNARPVQKLSAYLQKGASELLAADPQIQRRFALSAKAPLLDRPLPAPEQFHEVTETLVKRTKLVLTQEMRVDEAVILDESAPLEKRRNALFRWGSRAIRIADILAKLKGGADAVYWFITTYVLSFFV